MSPFLTPIRRQLSFFSFLIFIFLLVPCADAQVDPYLEQGIKPYGSFHGGDLDTISLLNGNLFVRIPFYSLPQRGGKLTVNLSLQYNNKGFNLLQSGQCPPPQLGSCHLTYAARSTGPLTPGLSGVYLNNDQRMAVASKSVNAGVVEFPDGCYDNGGTFDQPCNANVTEYSIITSDGYSHQLADTGNGYYETIDGTAIRRSGTTVIDADGIRYTSTQVQDPNGNFTTLSASTITDTLGRSIPLTGTSVSTSLCPNLGYAFQPLVSASQFSFPAPSGGTAVYTFCYASVHYNTNFWFGAQSPPGCQGKYCFYDATGNITALQSVVLPNNTYWAFSYDSSDPNNSSAFGYADLLKITLPTKGSISYTYTTVSSCTLNPSVTTPASRAVTSRTVDAADGTGPHTWTYSYGFNANYTAQNTTVTSPVLPGASIGDDVFHSFTPVSTSGCQSYETETDFYAGSHTAGTLLKKILTDYSMQYDAFTNDQGSSMVPIRVTTVWPGGKTTKVETDYDSGFTYRDPLYGNLTVAVNSTYPATFGKPIAKREYDYGTNAAGPLLRQTTTSYLWQSNSNYLTASLLHLPSAVIVKNGSSFKCAETDYGYDDSTRLFTPSPAVTTQHGSPPGSVRGNLTSASRQSSTTPCQSGGTWTSITSYTNVYDTGAVYQSIDPLNHTTTFAYSSTFAGAYPTTATNALTQAANSNYDFNSGLLSSVTDLNGRTTSLSFDSLFRLTQIVHPDGGQANITHQESTFPFTATLTKKVTSSLSLTSTNVFDGLGRTTQTQLTDPSCATSDKTDITYDARGRVSTVSNPYCISSDATYGITTTQYDALSRATKVIPPDGTVSTNNVTTTYSDNATTVTDQAGKSRKSVSDGLGRLTQVFEDPAGSNYETDYTYDALNNLLTVNQKGGDANSANWRTRTFVYNSLSQLTSATNPESGAISYTYDANGNLQTKISPLPNQTGASTVTATYSYDSLNRITQKSFSDGTPTVKYGYDAVAPSGCTLPTLTINNGIGKRTGMCDAAGSEAWSYDITSGTGWKVTDARITNAIPKTTVYQSNFDSSLAALTYPSTRVVNYAYNAAARALSAIDSTGPINYATSAAYTPGGALSALTNGASVVSTLFYNPRLQPCRISVRSAGVSPANCTDATTGNILDFTYNFSLSTANNGNVAAITNNRDTTRSQLFSYDNLNRIATAKTTPTSGANCWDEQFGYDPWGNLLTIGRISGYTCSNEELLTISATTKNQISGYTYDSAGNLITIPGTGGSSYLYDAENHLKQVNVGGTITNYAYDGDGRRAEKLNGSSVVTKLYWYGTGSDPLDETDATGSVTNTGFKEFVFFNGKRIASRDSSNNVNYYFADHLGTARIVANSSGTVLDDSDFYPFGGERIISSSSGNRYKFIGKERDSESSLDNFGARFDSSNLGRFMSPDPKLISLQRVIDPQQWNSYGYVRNNPMTHVDPDGKELHIVIYNSSTIDKQLVSRVALGIVSKYQKAGVKNVSYEIKNGKPGLLQTMKAELLPTPHSHLLEIRKDKDGNPTIRNGEGGHNWDLGGHSAVDASQVTNKGPKSDSDLVTGLTNVGTHEAAHDLLGHQGGSQDIMNSSGEGEPSWLFNPNLQFSSGEAKALQDKYNNSGEVELTPPTPPPPKPHPARLTRITHAPETTKSPSTRRFRLGQLRVCWVGPGILFGCAISRADATRLARHAAWI